MRQCELCGYEGQDVKPRRLKDRDYGKRLVLDICDACWDEADTWREF